MRQTLVLTLLALVSGKPPAEEISLTAEVLTDVRSSSAPAYWSAQCGDRTYVGSYTLMMDWAECRDYCQYFPHSAELGLTFSFADILDSDTMECLRYNMNQQYTPGNGYAGHYWAGGYRGGDGQYRWDSGASWDFEDFVGNPGDEPFVHLTPGNNYQWNTKNERDDTNNGCLCKSEQTTTRDTEMEIRESECPSGWIDLGPYCMHYTIYGSESGSVWQQAFERCERYGAELISWKDKSEYFPLKYWLSEMCVNDSKSFCHWRFWTQATTEYFAGDWTWGETAEFVPSEFGWRAGRPEGSGCAHIDGGAYGGELSQDGCGQIYPQICKLMK